MLWFSLRPLLAFALVLCSVIALISTCGSEPFERTALCQLVAFDEPDYVIRVTPFKSAVSGAAEKIVGAKSAGDSGTGGGDDPSAAEPAGAVPAEPGTAAVPPPTGPVVEKDSPLGECFWGLPTEHGVPIAPLSLLYYAHMGGSTAAGATWPCLVQQVKWFSYATVLPAEIVVSISGISEEDQQRVRDLFATLPYKVPQVKYSFVAETTKGSVSRNRAVRTATLPVLTMFDGDDAMHPQRLGMVHKAFCKHADMHVFYSSYGNLANAAVKFTQLDLATIGFDTEYDHHRDHPHVMVPCPNCDTQHSWPSFRRDTALGHGFNENIPPGPEDTVFYQEHAKLSTNFGYSQENLGLYNMLEPPRCAKLDVVAAMVRSEWPRVNERLPPPPQ